MIDLGAFNVVIPAPPSQAQVPGANDSWLPGDCSGQLLVSPGPQIRIRRKDKHLAFNQGLLREDRGSNQVELLFCWFYL